jgi:hypothetical protein
MNPEVETVVKEIEEVKVAEPKMVSKFTKKKILIIVGCVVLALLVVTSSAAAFVIKRRSDAKKTDLSETSNNAEPTSSPTPSAEVSPTSNPSVTPTTFDIPYTIGGRISKLSEDLKLYAFPENYPDIIYYESGEVATGTYKGYKKVLALMPAMAGPEYVQTFVTKDYKTYIASKDLYTSETSMSEFDKKKVTKLDTIEFQHPLKIKVNDQFTLVRGRIISSADGGITTDFSTYKVLPGFDGKFKVYYNSNYSVHGADKDEPYMAYINGLTKFYGVDSAGLGQTYTLTTSELADAYEKDLTTYLAKPDTNYVDFPIIEFKTEKLVSTAKDSMYKEYAVGLPKMCSFDRANETVNLPDSAFTKIGTLGALGVYTLNDQNHPLYKQQYNAKVDEDSVTFKELNKYDRPTFEQYMAKKPLVFIKDFLNRWVMLGEYDTLLMGGCGKPVVYLYPEKPTVVQLSFTGPMTLQTHIPTYADGWKVLAHPNGTLVDQQPEKTNCDAYKSAAHGSEYAYEACTNNSYPYIYWSGQSENAQYPVKKDGWYVSRSELSGFLQSKLEEVGLNAKERSDMLEYWLPALLAKNKAYYRISFLQTAEMNAIAPMKVSPTPDTVFRIFLDWNGFDAKPEGSIQPQVLNKLVRKGFTLVEWGGLKK